MLQGVWSQFTALEGMQRICMAAILLLLALSWKLRRQVRLEPAERRRERRVREELEAYAGLDPSLAQGLNAGMNPLDARSALAKRVCQTVAEKSVFSRVAMLTRDPEGRFACVGRRLLRCARRGRSWTA